MRSYLLLATGKFAYGSTKSLLCHFTVRRFFGGLMLCITLFIVHFQSLMFLGLNWVNKIEMKQSSSSVDPKIDVLDMVSRGTIMGSLA